MVRKKKRDVKFIIYQCLYIFVIAYLALKGVTFLNVGEENDNDAKANPNEESISKTILDSLRNNNAHIDKENDTMITKSKLESLEIASIKNRKEETDGGKVKTESNIESEKKPKVDEKQEFEKPKFEKPSGPSISLRLKKNSVNTVTNQSDKYALSLIDNTGSVVVTIPPGQTKTFTLNDETITSYRYVRP